MLKKYFSIFSLFLIFVCNNIPLIAIENFSEKKSNPISLDYLKRLPGKDYVIGKGDKLKIIVSRFYPELDSLTIVDGEGTIYIPKLNRVYVENLTIVELTELLNEAFKEYVKYPAVEIIVSEYRPIRVFVKGEALEPGVKILPGSFNINDNNNSEESFLNSNDNISTFFPTVFDGIRSAGGITQFTDLSEVKIIRKNNISSGGGKIETTLNFENLLLNGDNTQNIRIYDSDVIVLKKSEESNSALLKKAILSRLNSKNLQVVVSGRVGNPGLVTVSRSSALNDAIDLAGGAKAMRGPVRFLRFNNNGTIDKRKFNFRKNAERGKFNNPYMRDGDMIIVGENFFTVSNQIIKEFTSPFIGIFSTYGLIKALND